MVTGTAPSVPLELVLLVPKFKLTESRVRFGVRVSKEFLSDQSVGTLPRVRVRVGKDFKFRTYNFTCIGLKIWTNKVPENRFNIDQYPYIY